MNAWLWAATADTAVLGACLRQCATGPAEHRLTAVSLTLLIALALLLTAGFATVAALTRDPARQAAVLAGLGLALAFLFTTLQAPDVALSQLAVGTAVTPLLILLTVRKVRREPSGSRGAADDPPPARLPEREDR